MYGAGCWAQLSPNKRSGIACSISGAGEHIIRTGLARVLGEALRFREPDKGEVDEVDTHQVILQVLNQQFIGRPLNTTSSDATQHIGLQNHCTDERS